MSGMAIPEVILTRRKAEKSGKPICHQCDGYGRYIDYSDVETWWYQWCDKCKGKGYLKKSTVEASR